MKTGELKEVLEYMEKNEIIEFLLSEFNISGKVFKYMNLKALKKFTLEKNKNDDDSDDEDDEDDEDENINIKIKKKNNCKVVKKEFLGHLFDLDIRLKKLNAVSFEIDKYFLNIYEKSIKYEKRKWYLMSEEGFKKSSVNEIADILIFNLQSIYFLTNTFDNVNSINQFEKYQCHIYNMNSKSYKDNLTVYLKDNFTV